MNLISEPYRELNAQLHEQREDYGTSGLLYADMVRVVCDKVKSKDVLDYGCGKRTLESGLGFSLHNYDPALPDFAASPAPADVVACTDVLEHIEPENLDAVLDDICRLTKKIVFLAVSTMAASKTLLDGRNTHLIQQPFEWWRAHLEARWRLVRSFGTINGFVWIGQSLQDEGEAPTLAEIGPPIERTVIRLKSVYTDEQRCKNIRSAMLRCLPTVNILPAHERTMVLACYGPSLVDNLERLRREDGDVWTVSGAHDVLLAYGITPMAHIESDPRPHKALCIARPNDGVVYFLCSACHRDTFNRVHGHETFIFHLTSSVRETNLIAQLDRSGHAFTVDGGTNVGMSAIGLGTALGYRRFSIYGMDCSFRVDERLLRWPKDVPFDPGLRHTVRFHAGPHPNEDQDLYRVWVDGQPFVTSPQLFQTAQDFLATATQNKVCQFDLHGSGFLQTLDTHLRTRKMVA